MKPGDLAPDFTLPDQNNQLTSLSELLAGGPVVLFFYPAAMTTGCTAQACHFRDLAAEFRAEGAQRVGISRDAVSRQHSFADAHDFDYPLLSDSEGLVAEQFGVKRRFGPIPVKRHTFVIDRDRTVLEVVKSEFNMASHADKALEALRAHASR
jgi:thioredoxin-dependent peroxiredoxin